MREIVLALDQGTTSSRALLFDRNARVLATAQREFAQHFPRSGWVEHDPEDLWTSTMESAHSALAAVGLQPHDIAAIGITNQRETTLVWERNSGRPIHRAIVWQDRRTAEHCAALKAHEPFVTARTGLLLDPYFSATKISWILDHVDGARERAQRGELCFGTVDSWLIWRLTEGRRHVTDATNAARTLLFDLDRQAWSDELLALFDIPRAMMPEVLDCIGEFGDATLGDATVPIRGVAGDQHAATIGQACFGPGMMKSTYGTGCFALLNTGAKRVVSTNRLLGTLAYRLNGVPTFALEGSIFVAGAAVQWLRDSLGLIDNAAQSGALAAAADPEQSVVLVPAFTGLGAPWWDPDARGALFGLTRATGPAELARAALESVCFQTSDLLAAMRADWGTAGDTVLRVDGGMVASDWMLQRLADLLDAPVDRPDTPETTALGAAWLAGFGAGIWPDQAGFAALWRCDRRFMPSLDEASRRSALARWHGAVQRTLTTA